MKHYLLFTLMVICFCMTGCSASEISKADHYNQFTKEETDISSLSERPFMAPICSNQSRIIYELFDGNVDGEVEQVKLYSYDLESKQFDVLSLEGRESEDTASMRVLGCMNEAGKLFLIREDGFYIYQENGKLDSVLLFSERDDFSNDLFLKMHDCQCDENFIYLSLIDEGFELIVLNFEMDILFREDRMAFLCPNAYDKCRLFVIRGDGRDDFYYFDAEKKKLVKDKAEKMKMNEDKLNDFLNSSIISGDTDYDFYYYDRDQPDDQVELIGVKNGKEVSILNFADLNIYPGDIEDVYRDGRGGFIVHTYGMDTEKGYYVWHFFALEKTDGEASRTSSMEKTEINFVGLNIPDEFGKVVFDFNQASDRYVVKYKDYSADNSDTDTARKKLYLDMMEGGAIDGLLLAGLPKADFVEKGMLADLSGYFGRDNGISADDFLPCVLEGMTDENGKIYSVYPEFTVKAFLSKDEQDLSAFGEYTDCLDQGKAVFTEQSGTALLNRMIAYSGDTFLGKDGGEPSFGDDFKELLRLIKAQSDSRIIDPQDSEVSLIRDNKAVFLTGDINFPYTYLFYQYLFGGEFYCTNYAVNRPVLQPWMTEIAMLEGTDKEEGMYEFLGFLFSEENYIKYFGELHFPVLRSIFEDKIKEMTATEEYVNRFGKTVKPTEFSYGIDDVDVLLGCMTEEQEQSLRDFIGELVYVEPMRTEYLTIIDEEAQLYFDGKNNLDEVCENIQKRIFIARNE